MESLQLIRVLSCQLCPKLPKLGPSCLSFRPFRQVGFGSLRRDQAEKVCLLANRSMNTGIGGDRGGYDGSGNHERSSDVEDEKEKERNVFTVPYRNVPGFGIRLSLIPYSEKTSPGNGDSHSKDENLGNGENQLLQNDRLKEIQDELTEMAQRSLNLWQQVAVLAKGIQQTTNDLIDQKSHEASMHDSKKRKRGNGSRMMNNSDDEMGDSKKMKTENGSHVMNKSHDEERERRWIYIRPHVD